MDVKTRIGTVKEREEKPDIPRKKKIEKKSPEPAEFGFCYE